MQQHGIAMDLQPVIEKLVARLAALESNTRAEVAGGVQALLYADLPAAGQPGRVRFVTNGRKIGEGPGAGTGVLAVDDGSAWIHPATDTPVQV